MEIENVFYRLVKTKMLLETSIIPRKYAKQSRRFNDFNQYIKAQSTDIRIACMIKLNFIF